MVGTRLNIMQVIVTKEEVVQIVHLIRDPRGILFSRKPMGFVKNASHLCNYLLDDLKLEGIIPSTR